ncbi:MAG: thermonuclease family protein [Bdellovibrionales bacterium]
MSKYLQLNVIALVLICTVMGFAQANGESNLKADEEAKLSSTGNSCAHTQNSFNCVEFLRNYDGDTLTVNIPNVHPLIGNKISVRVNGIDAPEKRGVKPCEKDRARTAQKLVQSLLKSAQRIDLRNVQRDKYFRILAEVWVDDLSIAEILIKNGLALPYDGGTKSLDVNWCRLPASAKGK